MFLGRLPVATIPKTIARGVLLRCAQSSRLELHCNGPILPPKIAVGRRDRRGPLVLSF